MPPAFRRKRMANGSGCPGRRTGWTGRLSCRFLRSLPWKTCRAFILACRSPRHSDGMKPISGITSAAIFKRKAAYWPSWGMPEVTAPACGFTRRGKTPTTSKRLKPAPTAAGWGMERGCTGGLSPGWKRPKGKSASAPTPAGTTGRASPPIFPPVSGWRRRIRSIRAGSILSIRPAAGV